jgi:hypothetical protein
METQGVEQLKLQLQRLKGVTIVANAELKIAAAEMADLARKMAPVDKGNLEKAIKVRYEGIGGSGRFQAGGGAYTVYVDNNVPLDGRDGKTVGDYAWELHEHLTPAGEMQLGPLSVEKQTSDPSIVVGGKFIERAGEEMREKINLSIATVVSKYIEVMDKG